MIRKNMSRADGLIRIVLALAIVALWYTGVLQGTWLIVALAVAAIFTLTGFVSFCPLYAAFRIRTNQLGQKRSAE